jgi:hypothetical protein
MTEQEIHNEQDEQFEALDNDPARELVRDLMRERGWRIPRLAKSLGIKEFIVRRWLNGKRRITIEELVQVAQMGGYSLDEAFGLTPTAKGKSLAPGAFHGELSRSLATIFLTVGNALAEQHGTAELKVVGTETRAGFTQSRGPEPTPATAKDRLDDRARASLGFITDGLRSRRTGTR